MPKTECQNCGGTLNWYWEEAIAKFGFGDGGRQVETPQVEDALLKAGYDVSSDCWGMHNTAINSIKKDGVELIPHDRIDFGYADPGEYRPQEIVTLLDKAFPRDGDCGYLF